MDSAPMPATLEPVMEKQLNDSSTQKLFNVAPTGERSGDIINHGQQSVEPLVLESEGTMNRINLKGPLGGMVTPTEAQFDMSIKNQMDMDKHRAELMRG